MNQENGNIKQLKLRIPMELFVALEQDADAHNTKPATHARHILSDALMSVDPDPKRVAKLVAENWAKINKAKGDNK